MKPWNTLIDVFKPSTRACTTFTTMALLVLAYSNIPLSSSPLMNCHKEEWPRGELLHCYWEEMSGWFPWKVQHYNRDGVWSLIFLKAGATLLKRKNCEHDPEEKCYEGVWNFQRWSSTLLLCSNAQLLTKKDVVQYMCTWRINQNVIYLVQKKCKTVP